VRRIPVWAFVLAAVLAGPLHAAEYRAPTGFNGHTWGKSFGTFKGLKLWHAQEVIRSPGKLLDSGIVCTPFFRTISATEPPQLVYQCQATLQGQGDGSFAVAEYYFNQDRNPWVRQRVEVVTISYLFCASWQGDYAPKDVKKRLTLCGARINFRSDTKQQLLAKRDDSYESNLDRILRQLIAEHGEPPGYEQRGRITIETEEERLTTREKAGPEYVQYRWCGVTESAPQLRPSCAATVTLVFDTLSGEGTVLYATSPMYDYAYGRHEQGRPGDDELYVLLNGRRPDQPQRYVPLKCTGTHICNRENATSEMSAEERKRFEP
jgi:hypothetical protein